MGTKGEQKVLRLEEDDSRCLCLWSSSWLSDNQNNDHNAADVMLAEAGHKWGHDQVVVNGFRGEVHRSSILQRLNGVRDKTKGDSGIGKPLIRID